MSAAAALHRWRPRRAGSPMSRALALGQGTYFALTGVWPLVSMRTFEAVTGPKVDRWLVKTVGVLVGIIGGVLVTAGARQRVTPEIRGLAAASALGLAGVDVNYAARGRISRVYLLDAVAEVLLVAAWVLARPTADPSSPASRRALATAKPRASLLK